MSSVVRCSDKELKRLLKPAFRAGYQLVSGGKHPRLVDADGRYVCSVPGSPSDTRNIKNIRASLRQRGVEL